MTDTPSLKDNGITSDIGSYIEYSHVLTGDDTYKNDFIPDHDIDHAANPESTNDVHDTTSLDTSAIKDDSSSSIRIPASVLSRNSSSYQESSLRGTQQTLREYFIHMPEILDRYPRIPVDGSRFWDCDRKSCGCTIGKTSENGSTSEGEMNYCSISASYSDRHEHFLPASLDIPHVIPAVVRFRMSVEEDRRREEQEQQLSNASSDASNDSELLALMPFAAEEHVPSPNAIIAKALNQSRTSIFTEEFSEDDTDNSHSSSLSSCAAPAESQLESSTSTRSQSRNESHTSTTSSTKTTHTSGISPNSGTPSTYHYQLKEGGDNDDESDLEYICVLSAVKRAQLMVLEEAQMKYRRKKRKVQTGFLIVLITCVMVGITVAIYFVRWGGKG